MVILKMVLVSLKPVVVRLEMIVVRLETVVVNFKVFMVGLIRVVFRCEIRRMGFWPDES